MSKLNEQFFSLDDITSINDLSFYLQQVAFESSMPYCHVLIALGDAFLKSLEYHNEYENDNAKIENVAKIFSNLNKLLLSRESQQ